MKLKRIKVISNVRVELVERIVVNTRMHEWIGDIVCHLRDRLSKVGGDGCRICEMVIWCLNVYCLHLMVCVCGSLYDTL